MDKVHRSRVIAKGVQTSESEAPELFVATPPIESLKYLTMRAAQDRPLTHANVA